jgi:hypothetical protein
MNSHIFRRILLGPGALAVIATAFCCLTLATITLSRADTTAANTIRLTTTAGSLLLDAQTGAPIAIDSERGQIATFGTGGWWSATLDDGSVITAASTRASVQRDGDAVVCTYDSPSITVRLRIIPAQDHIDLRARITPHGVTVTSFGIPETVLASKDWLQRVYFPEDLGRSLEAPFFQAQTGDDVRWSQEFLGNQGAADAGMAPTEMRDHNEPAQPVTVTDAGSQWLGDSASRLDGWMARCPRPPSTDPDVNLLTTPSGPLLSLQRVAGGSGYFIRWGGVFPSETDEDNVRAASAAVVSHLQSIGQPALVASGSGSIGYIDLPGLTPAADWEKSLDGLHCTAVLLRSPAEVLDAIRNRSCWLIVNPNDELMPSTKADEAAFTAALLAFVHDGGIWLHTGGAPFYYTALVQPYLTVSDTYPPLFSDFIQAETKSGDLAIYGVQSPSDEFVPARLQASGSAEGARLSREWVTWIAPGASWISPLTRIAVVGSVQGALKEYAEANGFERPLAAKLKPAVLATLKQSMLIKYAGGSFQEESAGIPLLPRPSVVHLTDYLHGGFDKQYPDLLPPNPAMGTDQDFRNLLTSIHASGDLMMPYTNPTWWCDGPRGPTFVATGDAALLLTRDGKPSMETYGPNSGWSLCTFHPAALAAELHTLGEFTQEYPVDLLFQDQIGARGPMYDFNPAAPDVNSYTQGMQNIARRSSARIPIATENGFDRIMNEETEYCGVCWGLVPTQYGPTWVSLWKNRFPDADWKFVPMALWIAHDKTLFTMHDLGQFVTNRETLAWVLALGYQISEFVPVQELKDSVMLDRLQWLGDLQRTFGPVYMGAPLTSWDEPSPGVYKAVYGRLSVTSNTTPESYRIDQTTSLAPYGFLLDDSIDKLDAGSLTQFRGRSFAADYNFISVNGDIRAYDDTGL